MRRVTLTIHLTLDYPEYLNCCFKSWEKYFIQVLTTRLKPYNPTIEFEP